jgi:hypothetical protein
MGGVEPFASQPIDRAEHELSNSTNASTRWSIFYRIPRAR